MNFRTLIMAFPLLILAGCQSGLINASAVDRPARKIAARHDTYVEADPKLSELERRIELRDTAELLGVLDAAKAATQPATK